MPEKYQKFVSNSMKPELYSTIYLTDDSPYDTHP